MISVRGEKYNFGTQARDGRRSVGRVLLQGIFNHQEQLENKSGQGRHGQETRRGGATGTIGSDGAAVGHVD